MPETWTIGRLLEWTTGYLKQHASQSPRLDAEVLLAHVLKCQRIALYTRFDEEPNTDVRDAYRGLVKERAAGKPVAYLVGHREFYSLSFRVTTDVLIPRPETEFVVVRLLDLAAARKSESPLRIADVGTGSGILAVCAARKLKGSRVTAIDISLAALEVARSNAADHGVSEQIEFLESDLFSKAPAEARFDFIVSNPPYISSAEMTELAPDVRNFEPRGALEAGPKGTEVIERLIPEAAQRLLTGGTLLIEVSPMIEPAVREMLAADPRLAIQPTTKDLAGLPRVVEAKRR
jgi:release factor glutamine methyltransferase